MIGSTLIASTIFVVVVVVHDTYEQRLSDPKSQDDCSTDEAKSGILPPDCVTLLHQV